MRPLAIALLCVLAAACARRAPQPAPPATANADAAFEQRLQQQLLGARPGAVIEIPAGIHPLAQPLTVRANGVTLRGAGSDRSVLSFRAATGPAAGLLVYGNAFTVAGLAIEDSKGDALAIHGGENIAIRAVRVAWSGGPRTANGSYGFHIEGARNVLIEDCEAYSASAAGVYLSQSLNVIVRRCHAEQNTAGIALANTVGADLARNITTGNSGGIVLFNSAEVTPPGHSARIFGNRIFKNNLGNFAAAGNALARIPAGCGVLVNSVSRVEIFDNDITDNQTANVLIGSSFLAPATSSAGGSSGRGATLERYPRAIYLYGNRFAGGGTAPAGELQSVRQALAGAGGGHPPDVVWDGYREARPRGQGPQSMPPPICVANGNAIVLDADGLHGYRHPVTSRTGFRCTLPKLPPVALPAAP